MIVILVTRTNFKPIESMTQRVFRLTQPLTHFATDLHEGTMALLSYNSALIQVVYTSQIPDNEFFLSFNCSYYSSHPMKQFCLSRCGKHLLIHFPDKLLLGKIIEKGFQLQGEIQIDKDIRQLGFCYAHDDLESEPCVYYLLDNKQLHVYSHSLKIDVEVEEKVESVTANKFVLEGITDRNYEIITPKHILDKLSIEKSQTPIIFKKYFQNINEQIIGAIPLGDHLVIASEANLKPSRGGVVQIYCVELNNSGKKADVLARFEYSSYNETLTTPKHLINLRWMVIQDAKVMILVTEGPPTLRLFVQKEDGVISLVAEESLADKIDHFFYRINRSSLTVGVVSGVGLTEFDFKDVVKKREKRRDGSEFASRNSVLELIEEVEKENDNEVLDLPPAFPLERQMTFGSPQKEQEEPVQQQKPRVEQEEPSTIVIKPVTHQQSPSTQKGADKIMCNSFSFSGSLDMSPSPHQSPAIKTMQKEGMGLTKLERIMFDSDGKKDQNREGSLERDKEQIKPLQQQPNIFGKLNSYKPPEKPVILKVPVLFERQAVPPDLSKKPGTEPSVKTIFSQDRQQPNPMEPLSSHPIITKPSQNQQPIPPEPPLPLPLPESPEYSFVKSSLKSLRCLRKVTQQLNSQHRWSLLPQCSDPLLKQSIQLSMLCTKVDLLLSHSNLTQQTLHEDQLLMNRLTKLHSVTNKIRQCFESTSEQETLDKLDKHINRLETRLNRCREREGKKEEEVDLKVGIGNNKSRGVSGCVFVHGVNKSWLGL